MEDFVTVSQAAKIRQLSTGHIRQLCIEGKLLGAQKLGNQWVIPKKSILDYEPGLKGFAVYWEHQRATEKAILSVYKRSVKAETLQAAESMSDAERVIVDAGSDNV